MSRPYCPSTQVDQYNRCLISTYVKAPEWSEAINYSNGSEHVRSDLSAVGRVLRSPTRSNSGVREASAERPVIPLGIPV